MNEVMNNILTRRSIRKFKDEPVPRELTEQVVQAGVWAPSGKNEQTWRFFVMSDANRLSGLFTAIGKAMGNPAYTFYGAKTMIMVTCDREAGNGIADGAAAMENMMLAAHSLGLGSCWINQLKFCGDDPDVRKLLDSYGVPTNHQVIGMVALGYPDGEAKPKPRKENLVTWLDEQ